MGFALRQRPVCSSVQQAMGVVLFRTEQQRRESHAMPENTAILDMERGKLDVLRLLPWQTDTSFSEKSWGYVDNDNYRDARSLIAELVDVVSKNGNLLLNVGPKADGTIPAQAQKLLLQMGAWLSTNGEAIYGSRPWLLYGEGTTKVMKAGVMGSDTQNYTAQDIRFTTRGTTLYAMRLDGRTTASFSSTHSCQAPRIRRAGYARSTCLVVKRPCAGNSRRMVSPFGCLRSRQQISLTRCGFKAHRQATAAPPPRRQ